MSMGRSSPVHVQLAALQPQWEQRLGMKVAVNVGAGDASILDAVALADLSFLPRFGLKGPDAQGWLEERNITLPPNANGWLPLPGGGVVARLGRSEFFLEDGATAIGVDAIRMALGTGASGVYPVIRQDAGFALAGARVNELLAQTCNVNFEEFGADERIAAMTQMIGVSVLVIRISKKPLPCYRVWCDPTFAPYFWETIAEIAGELGGGVIGVDSLPRWSGEVASI
jgi:sarcosine oxidase subunit gamma